MNTVNPAPTSNSMMASASAPAPSSNRSQPDGRILFRNVIVTNDSNSDDRILSENVPMIVDEAGCVIFSELINWLRKRNLIAAGSTILFYDVERSIFVHQGREPIPIDTRIPLKKFSTEDVEIKFRPVVSVVESSLTSSSNNNFPAAMMMSYNRAGIYNNNNSSISNYSSNQAINSSLTAQVMARRNCNNDQRMMRFDNVHPSSHGDAFFTTTSSSPAQYWSETPCNSTAQSQMLSEDNEMNSYNNINNNMNNLSSNNNNNNLNSNNNNEEDMVGAKSIPREKRVKERKIGYVHDRVLEWRRYYEEGINDEFGRPQRVNLDVAAGLVGLSRKTLDDYYKYIRKAEGYNFDFVGRSEEKIGVLRNFVRDQQNRNSKIEADQEEDLEQQQQQQQQQQLNQDNHEKNQEKIEENQEQEQQQQSQQNQTKKVTLEQPSIIAMENNTQKSSLNNNEKISKPRITSSSNSQQEQQIIPSTSSNGQRALYMPPLYDHEIQLLNDYRQKEKVTTTNSKQHLESFASASAEKKQQQQLEQQQQQQQQQKHQQSTMMSGSISRADPLTTSMPMMMDIEPDMNRSLLSSSSFQLFNSSNQQISFELPTGLSLLKQDSITHQAMAQEQFNGIHNRNNNNNTLATEMWRNELLMTSSLSNGQILNNAPASSSNCNPQQNQACPNDIPFEDELNYLNPIEDEYSNQSSMQED